jgi:phosphoribosylformylglycinamidine cyclo-ligase
LPDGLGARIESVKWSRAPIFDLVQRTGGIEVAEMRRAFNVGVGFVVVVAAGDVARALEALGAAGEKPFLLGSVVPVAADCPYEERVQWPE